MPRGRFIRHMALVGDATGYLTWCSSEGIYFAAKSGRLCGQAMAKELRQTGVVKKAGIRHRYLRWWDDEFLLTFRILDLLQRMFYATTPGARRWWTATADVRLLPAQANGVGQVVGRPLAVVVHCRQHGAMLHPRQGDPVAPTAQAAAGLEKSLPFSFCKQWVPPI